MKKNFGYISCVNFLLLFTTNKFQVLLPKESLVFFFFYYHPLALKRHLDWFLLVGLFFGFLFFSFFSRTSAMPVYRQTWNSVICSKKGCFNIIKRKKERKKREKLYKTKVKLWLIFWSFFKDVYSTILCLINYFYLNNFWWYWCNCCWRPITWHYRCRRCHTTSFYLNNLKNVFFFTFLFFLGHLSHIWKILLLDL